MSNTCKSCGARVIWAITVPGEKKVPLNPEECRPSEAGAFVLVTAGQQNYAYRLNVIAERIAIREHLTPERARARALARWTSHLSHFATCIHADQHRRAS